MSTIDSTINIAKLFKPLPLGISFLVHNEGKTGYIQIRNFTDSLIAEKICKTKKLKINFPANTSKMTNWDFNHSGNKPNKSNSWLAIPVYDGKEYTEIAFTFKESKNCIFSNKASIILQDIKTAKKTKIIFKKKRGKWYYKIHWYRIKYRPANQ